MLASVLGTARMSALAQTDGRVRRPGDNGGLSEAPQPAASAQSAAAPAAGAPVHFDDSRRSEGQRRSAARRFGDGGVRRRQAYATTTDINGAFRMDVPAGAYKCGRS